MDKQAEYGTQNGQGIAGKTVPIRPRAGALELARIVDAVRAGRETGPGGRGRGQGAVSRRRGGTHDRRRAEGTRSRGFDR